MSRLPLAIRAISAHPSIVAKGLSENRAEIIQAKTRTFRAVLTIRSIPLAAVPFLVDDAGIGLEDSQLSLRLSR